MIPEAIEFYLNKLQTRSEIIAIILNYNDKENTYICDIVLDNELIYQDGKLTISSPTFNGYLEVNYYKLKNLNENSYLNSNLFKRIDFGKILLDRNNIFNSIKKAKKDFAI